MIHPDHTPPDAFRGSFKATDVSLMSDAGFQAIHGALPTLQPLLNERPAGDIFWNPKNAGNWIIQTLSARVGRVSDGVDFVIAGIRRFGRAGQIAAVYMVDDSKRRVLMTQERPPLALSLDTGSRFNIKDGDVVLPGQSVGSTVHLSGPYISLSAFFSSSGSASPSMADFVFLPLEVISIPDALNPSDASVSAFKTMLRGAHGTYTDPLPIREVITGEYTPDRSARKIAYHPTDADSAGIIAALRDLDPEYRVGYVAVRINPAS